MARDLDKLIKQHEEELAEMRKKAKGEKSRRPATKDELADRYPALKGGYVNEDDDDEPAGDDDDGKSAAQKLKEKYPAMDGRGGGMSQQSKKVVKRKKRADEIGQYSADAEAIVYKTGQRLDKVRPKIQEAEDVLFNLQERETRRAGRKPHASTERFSALRGRN